MLPSQPTNDAVRVIPLTGASSQHLRQVSVSPDHTRVSCRCDAGRHPLDGRRCFQLHTNVSCGHGYSSVTPNYYALNCVKTELWDRFREWPVGCEPVSPAATFSAPGAHRWSLSLRARALSPVSGVPVPCACPGRTPTTAAVAASEAA